MRFGSVQALGNLFSLGRTRPPDRKEVCMSSKKPHPKGAEKATGKAAEVTELTESAISEGMLREQARKLGAVTAVTFADYQSAAEHYNNYSDITEKSVRGGICYAIVVAFAKMLQQIEALLYSRENAPKHCRVTSVLGLLDDGKPRMYYIGHPSLFTWLALKDRLKRIRKWYFNTLGEDSWPQGPMPFRVMRESGISAASALLYLGNTIERLCSNAWAQGSVDVSEEGSIIIETVNLLECSLEASKQMPLTPIVEQWQTRLAGKLADRYPLANWSPATIRDEVLHACAKLEIEAGEATRRIEAAEKTQTAASEDKTARRVMLDDVLKKIYKLRETGENLKKVTREFGDRLTSFRVQLEQEQSQDRETVLGHFTSDQQDTIRKIARALGKTEAMMGEGIAKALRRAYAGRLKELLAKMVDEGILTNIKNEGYRLKPEWHDLVT